MTVTVMILISVALALVAVATLTVTWARHRDPGYDDAHRHLETLAAQRPHVERLADRLEHEKSNNHFRIRVERALRGQW